MADRRDIIDDSENLTVFEVHQLKEISKYFSAGKMFIGIIIGLGVIAFACIHVIDFIARAFQK